jgi:hypothetical protein
MNCAYLYPSEPCEVKDGYTWLDDLRDSFKESKKTSFVFSFLWKTPRTLPSSPHKPYWLYFFFSEKRSGDKGGQVPYRVRVIDTSYTPFPSEESVMDNYHYDHGDECKAFFKADLMEEIRLVDGNHYSSQCFIHQDGKTQVRQAARGSIPPVRRTHPLVVIQRTMYEMID